MVVGCTNCIIISGFYSDTCVHNMAIFPGQHFGANDWLYWVSVSTG